MSLSIDRSASELPHLHAFHMVCVAGGFSAAARRLGCTQPSVSYQIRTLERTLGVKLLERSGRRMLLTPAGERLQTFCRDVFDEFARVRSECLGARHTEPFRLGSASGFGRYVLMPALHELAKARRQPPLTFHVLFDAADVVLDRLEQGECEAAFVYSRRVSNRLRFRRVYNEELVLIAAPSMKRRITAAMLSRLSSLEQLPFVTYQESDYVFGRWFDTVLGDQPAATNSVAHFSELEEVIDFVRRGVGLSIVPWDAVASQCARGEIVIPAAARGQPCMNQVFMVQRAGSTPRAELAALTAILAAE